MRRAAEAAGLAPDVAVLPDGYQTLVGERGITLSGGQRQRVALARALAAEPHILILDDSLSSVDAETERTILTRLRPILAGRTSILISHRVAAVKDADQILVLDGGRVAESGTHAALLALGRPLRVALPRAARRRRPWNSDGVRKTSSATRSIGRCCAGSSASSGRTGAGCCSPSALLPVVAVLEIAQPYLLKKAIDEHIAVGKLEGLDRIGFLYLLALVGQYAAGFAQLYFTQVIGQLGMNDLRMRVHRHVMSLSASFFDRTPVGRLMTRMTNDIESLSEMFASGIVSLLGDVVRLTAILFAMFAIDWRLALFSMGSAPVLFAIAAFFRKWVRDAFRDIRVRLARMNAFLQEHISGMKVVQAFAQRDRRSRRDFDVINVEYRRANSRAIAADAALYSIVEAVGSIAIAGLLWHGGSRIVAGHADLRRRGRVHRIPGEVLRADPRPVDEVHRHAAGDGRRRARLHPARHQGTRRAVDPPSPACGRGPG